MDGNPDEIDDLRRAVKTLAEAVSRQADQIRALREEVDALGAAAAYGADNHNEYGRIAT
jgi:hypothetical protein